MNVFSLSPQFCCHNGTVVLEQTDGFVRIGIRDEADEALKERIRRAYRIAVPGGRMEFVPVEQDALVSELARRGLAQDDSGGGSGTERQQSGEFETAIALLDAILIEARRQCATDIHIEQETVRFRTGGVLRQHIALSLAVAQEMTQRIKFLARLNVSQRRCPQDGQFVFDGSRYAQRQPPLFVRVSCVPVSTAAGEGESVVLRLLDPERRPLLLGTLGFPQGQLELLEKIMRLRDGLVLVCGPTGSGKSTTLAALLARIASDTAQGVKIISLEDPPEYVLPGVTQVGISRIEGMSFEEVLSRVFRQDPDIVMIGEIRDRVTARTAVQAALTGHLVFATVHTGSEELARSRMADLGADVAVLDQVLRALVVQHLEHGILEAEVRLC